MKNEGDGVPELQPSANREVNRRNLLRLIQTLGPVPRPQLAALTGLSVVTVAKIVRQLERDGLVEETGLIPSNGGRPAGILQLKSDGGYVAGLLPREHSSSGVVMNLRGEVVHFQDWDQQLYGLGVRVVDVLADQLEELIAGSGLPSSRMLGVGIGCPGLIDAVNGRCIEAWALGCRDLDLAKPLEERLRLPVLVDNDVNCLTAYEVLFGQLQHQERALVITSMIFPM